MIAIKQIYRCYRGDPSLLTDLVRCQVVFSSLNDMKLFIQVSLFSAAATWSIFNRDWLPAAFAKVPHAQSSRSSPGANFNIFSRPLSYKLTACIYEIDSTRATTQDWLTGSSPQRLHQQSSCAKYWCLSGRFRDVAIKIRVFFQVRVSFALIEPEVQNRICIAFFWTAMCALWPAW